MNVSEYLARYNRPVGILLVSWTAIYLAIRWYAVRVLGEGTGIADVKDVSFERHHISIAFSVSVGLRFLTRLLGFLTVIYYTKYS